MGDSRFKRPYEAVRSARDRLAALRRLEDEEVVEALAAASQGGDPLLANVLATEAVNRVRRLRASLAHLGEGVLTLSPDGRIQWMNPAAERLLGWRRDEVMGQSLHEITEHFDAAGQPVPADACRVLAATRSRGAQEADGEFFRTRSGGELCVAYTSAAIRTTEGDVAGIVVAFHDVSERKRAEHALDVSEQRYRSLFEGLPDPVLSITRRGQIEGANDSALAVTGRRAEDVVGHDIWEFIHRDDIPPARAAFGEVLGGARQELPFRVRHAQGHYLTVHSVGIPILVEGKVVGIHGLMRGVTG